MFVFPRQTPGSKPGNTVQGMAAATVQCLPNVPGHKVSLPSGLRFYGLRVTLQSYL